MHSDIVEQELFRNDDEIKTKIRRRSPTLAALKRNRNSEGAANCFFQGTKIEDCSLCAVVVLFFFLTVILFFSFLVRRVFLQVDEKSTSHFRSLLSSGNGGADNARDVSFEICNLRSNDS